MNQQGDLVELDLATGKPHIFISKDKLADLHKSAINEKDKDHRARYGMADYIWSPDSSQILFDSNGELAIYDLKSQSAHLVGQAADSGDDPQFSPNGHLVAFIRDHGLQVADLTASTIAARPLAPAPNATTLNGEVDWVYQEELDVRTNYAWSPDSAPSLSSRWTKPKSPPTRSPTGFPTTPTSTTSVIPRSPTSTPPSESALSLSPAKTTWVTLPITPNQDYIPRFGWLNAKTLWVQTLTRDHKHKSIYFADATTGKSSLALALTDDKFFDESYDMHFEAGSLIFTDWQDGHNHIYRYTYDTANPTTLTLAAQLTHGDFEVESIVLIDTAHSTVYYASNEGDPISSNFWKVDFKGNHSALTTGAGSHHDNISPDAAHYLDSFSNLTTTGSVSLCQTGGSCNQLWSRASLESAHLTAPRIITTTAHDGKTILYSTLILPEGAKDSASVPVIVNPYGGPGPMTVTNA